MNMKCEHWDSLHATNARYQVLRSSPNTAPRPKGIWGKVALFLFAALSAAQAFANPTLTAGFSTSGLTLQLLGATANTCPVGQPVAVSCNKTTLVFTLTAGVGDGATSVSFTETLPSSLRVANPLVKGGTCANAAT